MAWLIGTSRSHDFSKDIGNLDFAWLGIRPIAEQWPQRTDADSTLVWSAVPKCNDTKAAVSSARQASLATSFLFIGIVAGSFAF
eukprot:CAMPEP_0204208688 /NCGR_PEP_ID=MMETSP0361-20130328/72668_1 /ASSEMBLY_ACC=CAM_ASM_000343 /TAXON_ID=268821 /ORGANISM="Scrippsiella Hangoei, Strain SHTV-5" /LENGTH=83 /DNA_ID=CAMNT_0051172517 /DNA_START=46 /DNA_END=297 /DNA_ORIENTATION=-